ncbi:TetR/AcrR family transcriptional regulator [Mycobacterium camsae]|uniref:TetR/AcrR family transcriptional regulator n=1 Tax=Mycobacterium gordonae TaxID=1778 RepID=UPI00197D4C5E|nr:TetR/AcrR family transcriptional regulator [Mycobacterium gordonae]
MRPWQRPDVSPAAIPTDLRARVMPAVLDELARWGVERFSVEAMAERHHLDVATIYHYWGNRQQLIVDAAVRDAEVFRATLDTGSLRGDLLALARAIAGDVNTPIGRTFSRVMVMDSRAGHHDGETRMMFWQHRFSVIRSVMDRARARGEVREGVPTVAAIQIVTAPIYVRSLYMEGPVDDAYCVAIADLAWHALRKQ